MRPLLTSIVALSILVVSAGAASAHAGLMPGELVPGTPTENEVVLAHGCGPDGTIPTSDDDALPTVAVSMERLEGLILVPREAEGWSLTTRPAADGGVEQARWEYDDPAGTLDPVFLGVEVTAAEHLDGKRLFLPVVQDCVDGEQLAWVADVEADGQLPGMLVTIDSAVLAATPTSAGGLSSTTIIALAVALGLAAGVGTMLISRRRT